MAKIKEQTITLQRKIKLLEKVCPVCGEQFWGPKVRSYCGLQCANRAAYQKHAEDRRVERRARYRAEKRKKKATGSSLNASRV